MMVVVVRVGLVVVICDDIIFNNFLATSWNMNTVIIEWIGVSQDHNNDSKQSSSEQEWREEYYQCNDGREKVEESEGGQERNEGSDHVLFELEKFLLDVHDRMRKKDSDV